MSARRLFYFGLICFLVGWIAAGALEFWHIWPAIDIMILWVAIVAIAYAADLVARRQR